MSTSGTVKTKEITSRGFFHSVPSSMSLFHLKNINKKFDSSSYWRIHATSSIAAIVEVDYGGVFVPGRDNHCCKMAQVAFKK